MSSGAWAIETSRLHLWYGATEALRDVGVRIAAGRITSLIGPSGCGKSTLLRCFNRMNERTGNVRTTGSVLVYGEDIYGPDVSLPELRKFVGMVFQRPNPLPASVYDNLLLGLRIHTRSGRLSRPERDGTVEESLRAVGLWENVKDRLHARATELPLDQQQKLCIARLLPLRPSVILMDEPCSALDAAATAAVEDLIRQLAGTVTIVIVTHNMGQARRLSDDCIFMLLGEAVESGPTRQIFTQPSDTRTHSYLQGRTG